VPGRDILPANETSVNMAGPSSSSGSPLLSVRDVSVRFGGNRGARWRDVRRLPRPDRRLDRSQRCRQDDAVQLPQPTLHAQRRRHPVRRHVDPRSPTLQHPADRYRPYLPERGVVSTACRCSTTSRSAATAAARRASSTNALRLPKVAPEEAHISQRAHELIAFMDSRAFHERHRRRPAVPDPSSGLNSRAHLPRAPSCCCLTNRRPA